MLRQLNRRSPVAHRRAIDNNDYEQNLPDGAADDSDETANIPPIDGSVSGSAAADPVDDDLARITLHKIGWGLTTGTLDIELSDPGSVRLFKSDGTLLYDVGSSSDALTLNLADSSSNPYLAALTSGDVDVWVEGLTKDNDFKFSEVLKDTLGHELARDDVHMDVAQWNFIGLDGNPITDAESFPKESLLDDAEAEDGLNALPDGTYFKTKIDGISLPDIGSLRTTSGANADDFFDDSLSGDSSSAKSAKFNVIYQGQNPADVLSDVQRQAIALALDVNAVEDGAPATTQATTKPGPTTTLTTGPTTNPWDVQRRQLKIKNLLPNWGLGFGQMHHGLHTLTLKFPAVTNVKNLVAAAYADLKAFAHFQPNGAKVTVTPGIPYRLGHFELTTNPLFLGIGPHDIANVVASLDVLFVDDPKDNRLIAMTVGNHPLVGVRTWQVSSSIDPTTKEVALTITTESWDRIAANAVDVGNVQNLVGMIDGGAQVQTDLWQTYFDNIGQHWRFDPNLPAGVGNATSQDIHAVNDFSDYSDAQNPFISLLPPDLQPQ